MMEENSAPQWERYSDVYPGAGHSLDKVADKVHQVVRDWVIAQLDKGESE